MRINKKNPKILTIFILFVSLIVVPKVSAQEGWVHPSLGVGIDFDDNIFLTRSKPENDAVTHVRPGIRIEPDMSRHKLLIDYQADIQMFSKFPKQNNDNHYSNALFELDFNKLKLEFKNEFNWFSDRSGSEDVNRIPRTQEHASVYAKYEFSKINVSIGYAYKLEDYRSKEPIGSFKGRELNYQDMDRQDHMGEIETEIKLWPKVSLLISGDYGTITYRTKNKSDSVYFDAFIGVKGKPVPKVEVEAKIGYRGQFYENYDDDFNNAVFKGSVVYDLTSRDVFRFDFSRTTYDTIYRNNAYYTNTFGAITYEHGFNDRVFFNAFFAGQCDQYPTQTTEFFITKNRKDFVWSGGCGIRYELPAGFIAVIQYEYLQRDSNLSSHDYTDNRVLASLTYEM